MVIAVFFLSFANNSFVMQIKNMIFDLGQ